MSAVWDARALKKTRRLTVNVIDAARTLFARWRGWARLWCRVAGTGDCVDLHSVCLFKMGARWPVSAGTEGMLGGGMQSAEEQKGAGLKVTLSVAKHRLRAALRAGNHNSPPSDAAALNTHFSGTPDATVYDPVPLLYRSHDCRSHLCIASLKKKVTISPIFTSWTRSAHRHRTQAWRSRTRAAPYPR